MTFAVVGEGLGDFDTPAGLLLWPLMRRLAGLSRAACVVTTLSKRALDHDADDPLPREEFALNARELIEELDRTRPSRILAVGDLAAKALLGDRFTEMYACNGMGFDVGAVVIPTWHPQAAMRPGGEDRLAYTGAAVVAFGPGAAPKMCPSVAMEAPKPGRWYTHIEGRGKCMPGWTAGIDTEGTPDDPICMTVASTAGRCYVEAKDVARYFEWLDPSTRLLFHNALWDWSVLHAMGAPRDLSSRWRWADTMELAYLRQTEPKGLKDLAYRHLGIRMRSFEDVVLPHYHEMLRATAEGCIEAGSTVVRLSPKGRLLKKPKVTLTEEAKVLKRALHNPKLLAERLPGLPLPTLRLVPEAERVEYATLDAWATVMLEEHLR